MGLLDFLFKKNNDQLKDFLSRDAVVLDVRTQKEYDSGHIVDCMHVPLQELHENIDKIAGKNKPIIAYCRSGIRSGEAASILQKHGIDSMNGGGIASLKKLLGKLQATQ